MSDYSNPYRHITPKYKTTNGDIKLIAKFIGIHRNLGKVLDIGSSNPKGKGLEKHFGIEIDNTTLDLDINELYGSYDTVFCFEVIEHVFNSLHLLLEIKKVLKIGGRLFITTPKHRPYLLRGKEHFHEFYKVDLLNLAERAGFKIMKFRVIRRRLFWTLCYGVEPLINLIFGNFYLELAKEV